MREDAALLRIGHLGLEADHIVKRPFAFSWRSWTTAYGRLPVRGSIRPTGRIGPKASVSRPRSRHLLDRHAAFEVDAALEAVRRHLLGGEHRVDKALVFLARQRQFR